MGDLKIRDGAGSGRVAKVNNSQRLLTDARTRTHPENASLEGRYFNVNTGILQLTSANKSGVFYIKNTGTKDIIVDSFFYLLGGSTGGSGDMIISVLKNPTTGTVITNATNCEIVENRNFASTKPLDADTYKGTEGSTFTDGDKIIESIINTSSTAQRITIPTGGLILQKSNSVGIDITPGTGNTALSCEFAAAVYIRED